MILLTLPLHALLSDDIASAQSDKWSTKEWYIGIDGGVPFGFSSFSSFGSDKPHIGFAVGLYGGYRFNSVLSAELSAKYGNATLSPRSCCVDASYWLGSDRKTYHASVAGLDGNFYNDLRSRLEFQEYGVRLNVNLLGFFDRTRASRWLLELSPSLSAIGTKAEIENVSDGNSLVTDNTKWHLGAGGNLQASYRVTRHLSLGIY